MSAQAIDLSPTGRLRVAITTNNTSQNNRDPATGEWRGVWIDLAHALAQRLGVPLTLAAYATDAERDAGMQRGEWDIATTADTPDQAATTGRLLAVPYLDVDNTLLVGPSASIRSIAEMDRPGVRIAAVGGTPPERAVSRVVQQATVVRATAAGELVPLLQSGQVDALAGNRPNLLGYGAQVPGSRLLADRFAVQQQRITLAPGRSAASVALASEVTRQALASGLIRTAIERYGVPGVQPTPLAAALPRTGRAVGSRPVPMVLLGIAAVVTLLGGLAQWHGSAGTLIWRRQRRRAVRWAPRFALRRRAGANLCAPSAVRPCRAAVPDAPPGRLPNPPATHVG